MVPILLDGCAPGSPAAVFDVDRREQHADGVPADVRTVVEFVAALATAFR